MVADGADVCIDLDKVLLGLQRARCLRRLRQQCQRRLKALEVHQALRLGTACIDTDQVLLSCLYDLLDVKLIAKLYEGLLAQLTVVNVLSPFAFGLASDVCLLSAEVGEQL